jgi:hypothetical protein
MKQGGRTIEEFLHAPETNLGELLVSSLTDQRLARVKPIEGKNPEGTLWLHIVQPDGCVAQLR